MKFPDAMTTPPVPASPEKSRIPVMFSATGGWGLPLGVAIHTLCLHAGSGRFYDIHIVHDGMDARIIQELNRVAAPFTQVSLSFLQLPEEFRQLFQNGNKDRYSPLAYARLMAGSLFPQYGRIVYLDADVLLAGDVAELYFSDLRGASVAAAGDGLALWSIEKGTMHPHLEYMGNYLSSPLSYCNSGVLVLDLDQMRRRNLEHRLLQWLRRLFPADLQTPMTSAFNAACAVPASAGVPVPCPWPGGAPPWSGTAANGRLSGLFSGRHVRKCRPAEYCRPGHCP